jgi:hypothetical protein
MDNQEPIFSILFYVEAPRYVVLGKEFIEQVGVGQTLVNGEPINVNPLTQVVRALFPASRIIETYVSGQPIAIVNEKDIIEIYKIAKDFYNRHSAINKSGVYKVYDDELLDKIALFLEDISKNFRSLFEAYSKELGIDNNIGSKMMQPDMFIRKHRESIRKDKTNGDEEGPSGPMMPFVYKNINSKG